MEFLTDFEINGEILIPLENSKFFDDKENITLKEISECSYNQFRGVLFQGELIRLILITKCDNYDKNLFDKLLFKVEFEGINTDLNTLRLDDDSENSDINTDSLPYDLFTLNNEKINEKNYKNEKVSRKYYDEENHIGIYEIFKQIIVPKTIVGSTSLMKIQLMIKNEKNKEFIENTIKKNIEPMTIYKRGLYKAIEEYKLLKTIFKEIQIIRPINITSIRQIDLSVESFLLQVHIQNITENIDFIDHSLKNSKFLNKISKDNEFELKSSKYYGEKFKINEIQILEEETSLDEQENEHMAKINEAFFRNLNKIYFNLLGAKFPIILQPSEQYNLTMKITKNSFVDRKKDHEKESKKEIQNTNNQENENSINKTDSTNATNSNNNDTKFSNIKKSNSNMKRPSIELNVDGVIGKRRKSRLKTNSIVVKTSSQFSLINNERLMTNVGNPLFTESSNYYKNINTKGNICGYNLGDDSDDISLLEDKIRINLITPVIIYISSSLFYENLFIGVQIKWVNEIIQFLKIEMTLPKEIYINEFFEMKIKMRNISSNPMNLYMETKEDDMEDEHSNKEFLPSIIAQTKFQSLGQFNCNEDKIFMLKFLPCKIGVAVLPNFAITDAISSRRFFIVPTNKIIIRPADGSRINELNRFMSMNLN